MRVQIYVRQEEEFVWETAKEELAAEGRSLSACVSELLKSHFAHILANESVEERVARRRGTPDVEGVKCGVLSCCGSCPDFFICTEFGIEEPDEETCKRVDLTDDMVSQEADRHPLSGFIESGSNVSNYEAFLEHQSCKE